MRSEKALARKNLVVDQDEVRALKRVLNVATESEAVRIAVRDRLALEDAQAAVHRIRSRGFPNDSARVLETSPAYSV
jgi:Arc/MetJ family transcription regulator